MTLPNFLIVGAAKSGTTSLYAYLAQHPDIFMPVCKEPHFFSNAHGVIVRSLQEYEKLFDGRTHERAVGEASVSYLFDPEAPKRILEALGKVKIIILLRNPVDRAYSQWSHMFNIGYEPLSFEQALAEEPKRITSPVFAETCLAPHPGFYGYFQAGLYYEQVKRYLDTFGPENVKVLIFEEFVKEPLRFCQEVFAFLGVDASFQPKVDRHNPSHTFKRRWLHSFLVSPPALLIKIYKALPASVRIAAYRVLKSVYWANMKEAPRQAMDARVRAELTSRYLPDIIKLEQLLGRDLSFWYREAEQSGSGSS